MYEPSAVPRQSIYTVHLRAIPTLRKGSQLSCETTTFLGELTPKLPAFMQRYSCREKVIGAALLSSQIDAVMQYIYG